MIMTRENKYYPESVPHPGETLAEKLEEMGMGPKEFALRSAKPEKTITAILKGTSSITSDMAVQFENVTKIPAHFWMNHQRGYDEYITREKWNKVIDEAADWVTKFPIADMMKKGWVPEVFTIREQAAAMLVFFGIANHRAWEQYYFNQQLKIAFRISLKHTKDPYTISAWLRKGELQAAKLTTNGYSEKSFKDAMGQLTRIMLYDPEENFEQLQSICLEAGVKVVHTPGLPKAPITGCTRWLRDTPLIQISCSNNNAETFRFTFFHEAGHILLHGKKDVFLESVEYSESDQIKEKEADDFAALYIRN
jgi:addiction module HigA family antidote